MGTNGKKSSNVEQWPRKVLCDLCTPNHMVDARGIKMHQQKIRSEQQVLGEGIPLVEGGMQLETFHYSRGYVEGFRAALGGDVKKIA
jgi:hypothetical protein